MVFRGQTLRFLTFFTSVGVCWIEIFLQELRGIMVSFIMKLWSASGLCLERDMSEIPDHKRQPSPPNKFPPQTLT